MNLSREISIDWQQIMQILTQKFDYDLVWNSGLGFLKSLRTYDWWTGLFVQSIGLLLQVETTKEVQRGASKN